MVSCSFTSSLSCFYCAGSTIMSQIIPFYIKYVELCHSALSQLFWVSYVVYVLINVVYIWSCLGFCTWGNLMDVIKSSCSRAYFHLLVCVIIRWYDWYPMWKCPCVSFILEILSNISPSKSVPWTGFLLFFLLQYPSLHAMNFDVFMTTFILHTTWIH